MNKASLLKIDCKISPASSPGCANHGILESPRLEKPSKFIVSLSTAKATIHPCSQVQDALPKGVDVERSSRDVPAPADAAMSCHEAFGKSQGVPASEMGIMTQSGFATCSELC